MESQICSPLREKLTPSSYFSRHQQEKSIWKRLPQDVIEHAPAFGIGIRTLRPATWALKTQCFGGGFVEYHVESTIGAAAQICRIEHL